MLRYFRLLRFQDQYVQLAAVLNAAILLKTQNQWVVWWAIAVVLLSLPAYIVNEVVDSADTDIYSWNKAHIKSSEPLNYTIVSVMIALFSIAGIWYAFLAGLAWWGFAYWVIGLSYSLEPFRFKKRFALDIIVQFLIWWIIPFSAPLYAVASHETLFSFLILSVLLMVPFLLMYQVADIIADRKAGLRCTHVLLGTDVTLRFGLKSGLVGLYLYFLFGMHRWAWWTIPLPVLFAIVALLLVRWIRIDDERAKLKQIQRYVPVIKPVTQLLLVYLIIVWKWVI